MTPILVIHSELLQRKKNFSRETPYVFENRIFEFLGIFAWIFAQNRYILVMLVEKCYF